MTKTCQSEAGSTQTREGEPKETDSQCLRFEGNYRPKMTPKKTLLESSGVAVALVTLKNLQTGHLPRVAICGDSSNSAKNKANNSMVPKTK